MKLILVAFAFVSIRAFAVACGDEIFAKCDSMRVMHSLCPHPETPDGPAGLTENFSLVSENSVIDFAASGKPDLYRAVLDSNHEIYFEIDNAKSMYSYFTVSNGAQGVVRSCEKVEER